jgi:hypothetical protein
MVLMCISVREMITDGFVVQFRRKDDCGLFCCELEQGNNCEMVLLCSSARTSNTAGGVEQIVLLFYILKCIMCTSCGVF